MQAAPHTYALYSKHCRAVSARNLFFTNQDFSKIIVILVISTSLHHSEILRGSFSPIEIIRLSISRCCNGLRQLRIWGFSGFSETYHLLLLLNLLLSSLLPKIVHLLAAEIIYHMYKYCPTLTRLDNFGQESPSSARFARSPCLRHFSISN